MAEVPAPARATKGRAPHRRDEQARLAVLHAADDLLVERGYAGVTVEGIASRAGVAKQTIYRWWSSKFEILLDTLIEDADRQLPVPVALPVQDSLRRYLRAYARFLTREPAGQVMLALIGQAQHDPVAAEELRARFLQPRRERERALLHTAVDAGELAAGEDLDGVLDALCGPIVWRALSGSRIPRAYVDSLIAGQLEAKLS